MVGIYKITSPSGKIYIGQSWNISNRKSYYKNRCSRSQALIYKSISKYGWDKHKFEIIHDLPKDVSQQVLDDYEVYYIDVYKSSGFSMLNIREGGSRGKHTIETRKKMSDNWNRPKLSKDKRNKISEKLKKYYKENTSHVGKSILQCDLKGNIIREWNSAREASKELGINYKNISAVATCTDGRYKTYKNFTWKFKI